MKAYHRVLRTFYTWAAEGGDLPDSPMVSLKPPIVRQDQIQPFSKEQVNQLLAAARASTAPAGNETLLLLMLDTGCRASEVIAIRLADVDLTNKRVQVHGKSSKDRTVFLGR